MATTKEKFQRLSIEIKNGADISIINLVECLLEIAYKTRVSDIHIDPTEGNTRVRFRVDGVLQESYEFPKNIHSEIISRIKVLSKLRTDEHQATQDGRFRYEFPDNKDFVDLRVSIMPTYHGENCVLRLLSDKAEHFSLETLGFSEDDQRKIIGALKKTSGMILATGPTGSGKTTTLYTLVKILNSPEVSIVTIEDPIEYAIEDIKQVQVNTKSGLTFANGLRSILRQDPNIIMVGEIRDSETANISVNTALTGHLLLSTLHTSDSATTLPRLLDMGIEEYLVASTVSIAIGQRLVRKICLECREKIDTKSILKESLQNTPFARLIKEKDQYWRGVGCKKCNNSGFSGRISINEVLVANETIKEAILRKASASEIKKIAIECGMTTMFEDGYKKVISGITTIEEVLRVINE